MTNRLIFVLCAAVAGCTPIRPPAPGPVTYTVGKPYQLGGEWRYPREFSSYDVTGLGVIIPHGGNAYTTDNELYDSDGLMAASPVLPLPSIVTVTNLVNGYSVKVRVNGRGPAVPGRVIAVTPHVARLLRFPSGGVVEVEVKLDRRASAALQGSLGVGPKLAAAPVPGITAQTLPPPGSGRGGGASQQLINTNNPSAQHALPQLNGQITITQPAPGPLWVQVAGFGSVYDAARIRARLYGLSAKVVPVFSGGRTLWAVNAGPYHSVEAADHALQQILQAGVPDPEIIVR